LYFVVGVFVRFSCAASMTGHEANKTTYQHQQNNNDNNATPTTTTTTNIESQHNDHERDGEQPATAQTTAEN
jgi:hypothetical protein